MPIDPSDPDIRHRPSLPENEDDDPVVDSGPGIDDDPEPVVPPVEDDKEAAPEIKLPGQPGAPERA